MQTIKVAKRAKKRLRRKERSERKKPLRGNEIAYLNKSPNYCEKNDSEGAHFSLFLFFYALRNVQKINHNLDFVCKMHEVLRVVIIKVSKNGSDTHKIY